MQTANAMKVYGILLVVLAHITVMYTGNGLYTPAVECNTLSELTWIIYAFHMPMFVIVSGMVFGYQCEIRGYYSKKSDFFALIKKKASRLLLPYYFWAFFWVVPYMVISGHRSFFNYAYQCIILSYDCRHLWFVMMLFECFVLWSALKLLCQKFRIPIWAIFLFAFALYLCPLDGSKVTILQLYNLKSYFLYFVIGYCWVKYFPWIKQQSMKLPILILLVTVALNVVFSGSGVFNQITKLFNALTGTIAVYYVAKFTFRYVVEKRLFKSLLRNSFGIYLVHPILIYTAFHFTCHLPINAYIFTALLFVIILLLSILITWLLRKLHLNWALGEHR